MAKELTQVELTELLQNKWLKVMGRKLDAFLNPEEYPNEPATSTDLATLLRFMSQNGWTVDPRTMPKPLKDLMTKVQAAEHVSPESYANDEDPAF